MPQPQMPASAQANVGMTWLLDLTMPRYAMSGFHIEKGGFQYAAATDTRHRAGQRRHGKAAETCPRRQDKTAAERPKDAPTDHGSPRFCPFQAPCLSHCEALH